MFVGGLTQIFAKTLNNGAHLAWQRNWRKTKLDVNVKTAAQRQFQWEMLVINNTANVPLLDADIVNHSCCCFSRHVCDKTYWNYREISMTDEAKTPENNVNQADKAQNTANPGRRHALMLGAVGAATVVSVRPALAQAAGSVLNCEIPMPNAGQGIDVNGKLVPIDTPGSFPTAGQTFTGEQVKAALGGRTLPGTNYDQSQAYIRYIRRLQYGQSGFTCFASLQMPR